MYTWFQKVLDTLIPLVTLQVAVLLVGRSTITSAYIIVGFWASSLFIVLAHANRVYEEWRGTNVLKSIYQYAKVWGQTWLLVITSLFLLKTSDDFSRLTLATWLLITPVILITYKLLLRWLIVFIRKGENHHKKVAIAGAGKLSQQIAIHMQKNPWLGCKVTAFYDDSEELQGTVLNGVPVKGNLEDLVRCAKSRLYTDVYIALPLVAHDKLKSLIAELSNSSCHVNYAPDIFNFDLLQSKWTNLGGIPIFSIYDSPLDGFGRLVKRTEDIVLSIIIIILISPVLATIALALRLTSKQPILFKQRRYGFKGKEIIIWKFRTMDSSDDGDVIVQAKKSDKRITKIGSFLRRTSMDELPQFFNVIQGHISIVGPRPHASAHNEHYKELIPGYMQRHLVKPGITGWAQVNGWRGETDTLQKMEMRIKYDLDYIKRWSPWFDIKILILTIYKGFIHKNAY